MTRRIIIMNGTYCNLTSFLNIFASLIKGGSELFVEDGSDFLFRSASTGLNAFLVFPNDVDGRRGFVLPSLSFSVSNDDEPEEVDGDDESLE